MDSLNHLCLGDTVELKKDKKGYQAKAEIKFIGPMQDKNGIFYGVAVDRAWKGKHNGTFKNIQYFETNQQRGLFAKKDRMTAFIEKAKNNNKFEDKRISINDSVSIAKLQCNGIVRFVGCIAHKPGTFYGIALEVSNGKHNGCVKGRQYFHCDNHCGIFLKIKDIERNMHNNGGLPPIGGMNDNNILANLVMGGHAPPPPPIAVNNNALEPVPGGPPPPPPLAIVGKRKAVSAMGAPPIFNQPIPAPPPEPEPELQEAFGDYDQDMPGAGGPGSPPGAGAGAGAALIESKSSHSEYDHQKGPGYTDPGAQQQPHSNYPMAQRIQQQQQQQQHQQQPAHPQQYGGESGVGGVGGVYMPNNNNMSPHPQYGHGAMPNMMFNQFSGRGGNVMAMQQKLMKMQQDIINNPQMATQKWVAGGGHGGGNSLLDDGKDQKEEEKVAGVGGKRNKTILGMFGSEYYRIEGILRAIGCDDDHCKYYINRMKANNVSDGTLRTWDTVHNMSMFRKVFPIEEGIRNRFRAWIRYDVQGYRPSFRKEEKADLVRKKSIFGKSKETDDEIIELNIGGIRYSTLKSTLIGSGSGYFKKLMKMRYNDIVMDENNKKNKKDRLLFDERGSYFIDRNGMLFELLLNYMQSGKLVMNYNKFMLEDLKKEFKFYGVNFPKDNKLPINFRFEYVAGEYFYNLEKGKYDFMVSNFRIFGPNKKTQQIVSKAIGMEWPKGTDDIEQFLKNKNKFLQLNYKIIDKTTYKCNDKENSKWTFVEYYQKYIWYKKK